jgi:hypothetical protein
MVIVAAPFCAQAQKPTPTKADAQKVLKIIRGDKATNAGPRWQEVVPLRRPGQTVVQVVAKDIDGVTGVKLWTEDNPLLCKQYDYVHYKLRYMALTPSDVSLKRATAKPTHRGSFFWSASAI